MSKVKMIADNDKTSELTKEESDSTTAVKQRQNFNFPIHDKVSFG